VLQTIPPNYTVATLCPDHVVSACKTSKGHPAEAAINILPVRLAYAQTTLNALLCMNVVVLQALKMLFLLC
jgi:hypothetical protein